MARGVIALLGSGETAPGMVKVHRALLKRLDPVRAVTLDSAYGFQENVEQVTGKIIEYFATSLRTRILPLSLMRHESASDDERLLVRAGVQNANYVFAGPGSPSYALNQWRPLGLVEDLADVLENDGVVCFASAAALTLGSHSVPVYEIYKVGEDPRWLSGLNLLSRLGLNCAVIPHFDNAEGRNYDTRFCYIGERRLRELEDQLPAGTGILGVDEHTALLIDLAEQTISVTGRSHGHWRLDGSAEVLENGTTIPIAQLRGTARVPLETTPSAPSTSPRDLSDLLARLSGPAAFDAAPLIESIVQLRLEAKSQGDFALADRLRAVLVGVGVEVRDTPEGTQWSLPERGD